MSASKNPHNIQVGQQLWFVYNDSRRGSSRYVGVQSIGREWAAISSFGGKGRINLQTLRVDGGDYSSPGTCYVSEDAYEARVRLSAEWRVLRSELERSYAPPPDMTFEKIAQIREIIGKGPTS